MKTISTCRRDRLSVFTLSFTLLFICSNIASAHGGTGTQMMGENIVEYKTNPGENYHLEIEAASLEGEKLPELKIEVTITNVATGEKIAKDLHTMFGGGYHYGTNIALLPGEYTLVFHIDPPTFMREDNRAGSWIVPVEATTTFTAVSNPTEEVEKLIKTTSDMNVTFVAEAAKVMYGFPSSMNMGSADTNTQPATPVANNAPVVVGSEKLEDKAGINILVGITFVLGSGVGFLLGRMRRKADPVV